MSGNLRDISAAGFPLEKYFKNQESLNPKPGPQTRAPEEGRGNHITSSCEKSMGFP